MHRRWPSLILCAGFLFVLLHARLGSITRGASSLQQQPTFRTGVTIVPLDVRVLDKDGRPVTDLTESDFTILEDNVPQKIAHFSAQIFEAGSANAGLRARPGASLFDVSPQSERVFLIVLGTAALGDPVRHPDTLNALLGFVRERLLPQDQVALIGNGRATDFTADHEQAAQMLERLGRTSVPPPVRLNGQGMPVRDRAAIPAPSGSVFEEAPPLQAPGLVVKDEMGLQEYAKASPPPRRDLDLLFYGIRYLRFVAGEKHLIFVNGQFSNVPHGAGELEEWPWDGVTRLIQSATDARVSIDTIQTGGRLSTTEIPSTLEPAPIPSFDKPGPTTPGVEVAINPWVLVTVGHQEAGRSYNYNPGGGGQSGGGGVDSGGAGGGGAVNMTNPLRGFHIGLYDLHYVASATGGQASMLDLGEKSLARIDTATRARYLIAYYPENTNWDGRYRKVRVKVNRPDVTVLFRHGYTASQKIDTFDKRAFITDSRLAAAGYSLADGRDIGVKMTPVFTKSATGRGGEVLVNLVIDASTVSFMLNDLDRHEAHLDIAVYCGNSGQDVIGQLRQTMNLNLTDATYDRYKQGGISHEMRVPVTGKPKFVKLVVLDYEANLTGSTIVTLK